MSSQWKSALYLVLLAILAFGVRLGASSTLRDLQVRPSRHVGGADSVEFNALAENVASGKGYVSASGEATSFRAPGFPLFLAAIYATVGINYAAVYVCLALLGAISCVGTYLLAKELVSERLARIAGLLSVVYLPHVYFATEFMSESLFASCIVLGLWLFVRHLKAPFWWTALLSGLLLGAATLTRPFALLLAPAWLVLLLGPRCSQWRSRILPASVMLAAFLAVILPWTMRNHLVHRRFVLIATNGGSTFYGSNNDRVLHESYYYGGWISTRHLPGRELIEATPDEVSHDKEEWRLGVQWVRQNWQAMPQLMAMKLIRFSLPDIASTNKKYVLLQVIGCTPFLLLMALSIVVLVSDPRYRTSGWLALHFTLLATVFTAVIFWGSPRFRDANAPLLMIYAALAVHRILEWRRGRRMAEDKRSEPVRPSFDCLAQAQDVGEKRESLPI